MKKEAELEALTNMANNIHVHGLTISEKYFEDKRKKVAMYFLKLGNCTLSPVLDYDNMNHFMLGFLKAKKLLIDKN